MVFSYEGNLQREGERERDRKEGREHNRKVWMILKCELNAIEISKVNNTLWVPVVTTNLNMTSRHQEIGHQ